MKMERDLYAPAQTSVWNWNTGPSQIASAFYGDAPRTYRGRTPDVVRNPRAKPKRTAVAKGGGRPALQLDLPALLDYYVTHTQEQCADHFGCSQATVGARLRELGIGNGKGNYMRGVKGRNVYGRLGAPLDIASMLQAYLAGATYREVAQQHNVSASCAFRRLQSHAQRVGVSLVVSAQSTTDT
jgi:hypothetical protein